MATQADVRRIALSLPAAEQVAGRFAFAVRRKGKLKEFVWPTSGMSRGAGSSARRDRGNPTDHRRLAAARHQRLELTIAPRRRAVARKR